jgi:hypothetical protein
MSSISALKWTTLTAAINQVKSPNRFLQRLLWADHLTVPTEDIELGVITGGREIAPFVKKNGEAILVSGTGSKFMTVAGPNIRLKQAMNPSIILYSRQPGTTILLPTGTNQLSAVQQLIARDLQFMGDMVTNATEYLCSRALQGSISISLEDGEVMTITIPRAAGNNITPTKFWDETGCTPLLDIHGVKEVMSEAEGLAPTDAICGSEAAHTFLTLAEAGTIKPIAVIGAVAAGAITFQSQFNEDGVIFLGELAGCRFWQYSRTANLAGVATAMIRAKYIEFVNVGGASERVMYFASIPDMDAMNGGQFQVERFSKSWIEKDPSRLVALTHSRPLPWPRKPDATCSFKAVSG